MIRQPSETQTKAKKIRMLIAGYPGIGKTTLGLSAPRALHIDIDFGIDRIEPLYRRPYIQPQSYQELLDDLIPANLGEFETLVFDTGGKLLDLMKPWAIRNDPKNGKRDGSLSLQGYGAVGREFNRLMDYCFYELDKHIVVLFHAVEDRDGDTTKLRLMVEGSTKNTVWIPMDLGGFLEMQGDNRTLGLSNCERYFAKGTRGINGILKVPELSENMPNDFLARLFDQYEKKAESDAELLSSEKVRYEAAMNKGKAIIDGIVDAQTANEKMAAFKAIPHALTSQRELKVLWNRRMKECGVTFDNAKKCYVSKDEKPKDKPLYDNDKGIQAQEQYCEAHDAPMFMPKNGHCIRCGKSIFVPVEGNPDSRAISVEEAGKALIKSCPHCGESFTK